MPLKKLFIYMLFFLPTMVLAQEKHVSKKSSFPQRRAAVEVSKSLEENKPDAVLAADYEKLAAAFIEAGDYGKAEENLEKAKQLYIKLKDKEKLATVERELAKVQEEQNKTQEAISNYISAGNRSKNKLQSEININDANRLKNQANPEVQSKYIQKNIDLLEQTDNQKERANVYQQMAATNLAMNEQDEAILNLENALKETEKPEEALKINRKIADVYVKEEKFEQAIEMNEKLLEDAKNMNNPKTEISQLRQLSQVYSESNKEEKAEKTLLEAYRLAVEQGNTLEAKNTLELLAEQYKKSGDTKKILELYSDFIGNLGTLLHADSTLIDTKTLLSIENRIAQLEKERALKDELIRRKNVQNKVQLGIILLILVFVVFIVKALYSINIRNKKIALQSLRREMNPHFIFNSLNSVNQFIAQNNELEANKYLSSYSKLMRNTMENSNKDFIPLAVELAQLKEYLQLEQMRFTDKFAYEVQLDPQLDCDAMYVPNMLIQPQLENAVWHGLRYKEQKGKLLLAIYLKNNALEIKIEDNGIGIKRSQELKTKHQKEHNSRGLTNTQERIRLLNDLYHTHIQIETIEKEGAETGVVVLIKVPMNGKMKQP